MGLTVGEDFGVADGTVGGIFDETMVSREEGGLGFGLDSVAGLLGGAIIWSVVGRIVGIAVGSLVGVLALGSEGGFVGIHR